MGATLGELTCELYAGAFSGEVVFEVATHKGGKYAGIAPKHYATSDDQLSSTPVLGTVKVHVIRNGGETAEISTPDGSAIEVDASAVEYAR